MRRSAVRVCVPAPFNDTIFAAAVYAAANILGGINAGKSKAFPGEFACICTRVSQDSRSEYALEARASGLQAFPVNLRVFVRAILTIRAANTYWKPAGRRADSASHRITNALLWQQTPLSIA